MDRIYRIRALPARLLLHITRLVGLDARGQRLTAGVRSGGLSWVNIRRSEWAYLQGVTIRGCMSIGRLRSRPAFGAPEAKACDYSISKPREWGSHSAAFRPVGEPVAPFLRPIQRVSFRGGKAKRGPPWQARFPDLHPSHHPEARTYGQPGRKPCSWSSKHRVPNACEAATTIKKSTPRRHSPLGPNPQLASPSHGPLRDMKIVGKSAFWPPDPQFWGNLAVGCCVIWEFEVERHFGILSPRILGAVRVCVSSGILHFYESYTAYTD